MRTRSLAGATLALVGVSACSGSVRPLEDVVPRPSDASQSDVVRMDASASPDARADAGPPRTDARPDAPAPMCPAGESALGRCDGAAVIRCTAGVVVTERCAADQRCEPAMGATAARCVTPMIGEVSMSGRVTYARRPLTPRGLTAAVSEGLGLVNVQLVNAANVVRAEGFTDASGMYSLTTRAPMGEPLSLRVRAARADATYQFAVENFGGATYAVTTMPSPAAPGMRRDLEITEASNAGAFAIFSTIRGGLDFVRRVLPTRAPPLRIRWERGRTPPGGTSYFIRGQNMIYLLGGPTDTDEYDLPVILHEFGHFVEQNFSRTSSPGGAHDGSPTDPRLAWGEGWGTWFGCVANGSSAYLDSDLASAIRVSRDLASLPLQRQNMGDPAMALSQPVGEYLVGGSLWALSSAGTDPAAQLDRSLSVSLRYFTRSPAPDRGVSGVDFVDFLDGYLCLHAGADRAVIEQYVVMQRRFPYDFGFAGVCR
jgi:hypothetical protein